MALTFQQLSEMQARRVQRATDDSTFVNTINLADRVTIDFVWYPGARDLKASLVDVILPVGIDSFPDTPREIPYTWERAGVSPVKRNLTGGRVTLELPPGSSGFLTVFDSQWKIVRKGATESMGSADNVLGMQRRLNALGYHLRSPLDRQEGMIGQYGQKIERAVLMFQVDYRQPSPAPRGAPTGPLRVRGEWAFNHPDLSVVLAVHNHLQGERAVMLAKPLNPSAVDAAELQAALVAAVGR